MTSHVSRVHAKTYIRNKYCSLITKSNNYILPNRIEIRLYEEQSESVSLRLMSAKALASFVNVVNALKELSVGLVDSDSVKFTIEEGSAKALVIGSEPTLNVIYSEINDAIRGQSSDKDLTSHLRIIQKELKNDNFAYNFNFVHSSNTIDLHSRIRNASKISVRRTRHTHTYELKIVRGFLNQIGGTEPNYHFENVAGENLTIDCDIAQAKQINQYLYSEINSLVISKEWSAEDRKDELSHRLVLEDEVLELIKPYLNSYYALDGLIEKLTLTHDFIDQVFTNNANKLKILRTLLIAFNSEKFHLSELKTLLVISKPLRNHFMIEEERRELSVTYNKMKNK